MCTCVPTIQHNPSRDMAKGDAKEGNDTKTMSSIVSRHVTSCHAMLCDD